MEGFSRKPEPLQFTGNVADWFEMEYDVHVGCMPENTTERQKAMLLLNLAGPEAVLWEHSFVYNEAVPVIPAADGVPSHPTVPAEDRFNVELLKHKFAELCALQRNIMERYTLNSRNRLQKEPFDTFHSDLAMFWLTVCTR